MEKESINDNFKNESQAVSVSHYANSNKILEGIRMRRESPSFYLESWQTDYAEHFLETLREKESKRATVTMTSPQVKYRAFMILKMKRVISRLALSGRVLHAGVQLLDVFMDGHTVAEDRLLHVALICLLIAIKFEVKSVRAPRFSTLCDEADIEPLTHSELWKLEWCILQYVRWDLCSPTIATFAEFFSPVAVTKEDYDIWHRQKDRENFSMEKFKLLIKNRIKAYISLTLSDKRLAKVPPSFLAAACVLATRNLFGITGWSTTLHRITSYTYTALQPMASILHQMMIVKGSAVKRRLSTDSMEDQGYYTGVSSPESSSKRNKYSTNPYDS